MVKFIPASKSHARAIARFIMEAMTDDCCSYFTGDEFTLSEFEDMMTELVEREDSQYSFLNTIVAVADDDEVVGACVSYDGALLHELRRAFVGEVKKRFNRDFSGMADETGKGELYIDSLAVAKEYRGRGFASDLIRAVLHKASSCGIDTVGLLVDDDNVHAAALYEKMGFAVVGVSSWGGHEMRHMQRGVIS